MRVQANQQAEPDELYVPQLCSVAAGSVPCTHVHAFLQRSWQRSVRCCHLLLPSEDLSRVWLIDSRHARVVAGFIFTMQKPWLVLFFVSTEGLGFLRTVFVEYEDGTTDGHFNFGRAIGEAMGADIKAVWAADSQLHAMEAWVPWPDADNQTESSH